MDSSGLGPFNRFDRFVHFLVFPYQIPVDCFARIGGVHRVLDYWWKFRQELTQFTHNFFPDVSWSIFLLIGSFPNRDHIMGIDLVETRTIQFCHFFLQIFANFSVMTQRAEISNYTTNFRFFDEIQNSISHWLGHILQQMEFNVEFGTFFSHLLKTSKGKIKNSPRCFMAVWMSN